MVSIKPTPEQDQQFIEALYVSYGRDEHDISYYGKFDECSISAHYAWARPALRPALAPIKPRMRGHHGYLDMRSHEAICQWLDKLEGRVIGEYLLLRDNRGWSYVRTFAQWHAALDCRVGDIAWSAGRWRASNPSSLVYKEDRKTRAPSVGMVSW
jgi:hypothetical protein